MSPDAFRAWQSHVGLSGREIAVALGKSEDTIVTYRLRGVPERESKIVRLALQALAHELPPWPEQ